jgi:YHS domain-containing protein
MTNRRDFILLVFASGSLVPSERIKTNRRAAKDKDPVCGIMVEEDPNLSAQYKGKTYYFCSKADRSTFEKTPNKYIRSH